MKENAEERIYVEIANKFGFDSTKKLKINLRRKVNSE